MTTHQHPPASRRLPSGGRIDRSTVLTFTVDGVAYTGHPGDTVGSALLANGRSRVADSLHRGRPRGIVAAGVEEPNALLRVGDGAGSAVLATTCPLVDGFAATTVAGPGVLERADDAAMQDRHLLHADVVVIGGGPAGLAAARSAARSGARVVLLDEQSELGGSLLACRRELVDGRPAPEWVGETLADLAARPEVTVLTRTVVLGSTDDHSVVAVQDRAVPGAKQRVWHISARRVVVATGARERSLVFSGNDRPGVMLASAVRTYLNRYAVKPGEKAVVATTNDSAYDTVEDLLTAGVDVVAVLDARDVVSCRAAEVGARGVRIIPCSTAQGTDADPATGVIAAVDVGTLDDRDRATCWETLECDLLAVAGGWSPVLPLSGHPVAGSAAGAVTLDSVLHEGDLAGAEAATAAGFAVRPLNVGGSAPLSESGEVRDLWLVPDHDGDPAQWDEHFVDLQCDQTAADLWRSAEMRGVEPGPSIVPGLAGRLLDAMREFACDSRIGKGR